MIIKKNALTTLAGGAVLSLAFAAAPLQAQSTTDTATDPTVGTAAEGTEMTAEEAEMAAEKAEAEAEEMAADMEEGAEEAGEAVDEATEGAAAAVAEAADDDETAAMLQQQIGNDPTLGVYGLDVIEMDGRYQVTGMIDKPEDYAKLEQMLGEVEGVDPSMIDNNVVVQ